MADEGDPRTEARLIEHLVGSVLTSVVKAQGLAASQLVELIDEVGFEPEIPGQPRRARTFSFEFLRNEIDEETETVVQQKVTANVPLLTLINLPAIAIEEAKIEMDLRLVAHQASGDEDDPTAPLKLYAVPAKKQLVRSEQQTIAVDSAGTIKMQVTMRQQEPLGLERMQALLEDGTDQVVEPMPILETTGTETEPAPTQPTPLVTPENLAEPSGPVANDVPPVKKSAKKADQEGSQEGLEEDNQEDGGQEGNQEIGSAPRQLSDGVATAVDRRRGPRGAGQTAVGSGRQGGRRKTAPLPVTCRPGGITVSG